MNAYQCGKRGFGLRAKVAIKKGQLIDEYRGEIINLSEATRRTEQFYKGTGNFYLLDYDAAAGEVIDGGMKGNRTRFANHSVRDREFAVSKTVGLTNSAFAVRSKLPHAEVDSFWQWSTAHCGIRSGSVRQSRHRGRRGIVLRLW